MQIVDFIEGFLTDIRFNSTIVAANIKEEKQATATAFPPGLLL